MIYVKILRNTLRRFINDERGASAIEYGLIAALIALVIIVAVTDIGEALQGVFESIADQLPGGGES